jgi:hypothetical protein
VLGLTHAPDPPGMHGLDEIGGGAVIDHPDFSTF